MRPSGQPSWASRGDRARWSLAADRSAVLTCRLLTSALVRLLRWASVTVTITGQWQLQITIRSDAFDEATVILPVSVHSPP